MRLHIRTLELLRNRPITQTLKAIESKTGIKESWLRVFLRGTIENPSVNTVQTLYEYLSNSKLKVN